ncbi:MAG: cyclase family protein [Planctomycetota bacterium]
MAVYDITLIIDNQLAMWPGDQAYELGWTMQQSGGDSVNVGNVRFSLHCGTHADAPLHVTAEGDPISAIHPEVYVGPAHLIDVRGKPVIQVADLRGLDFSNTPRLLLRTGGWTDHTIFPTTIPVVALDVPEFLAEQGVCLLGLDVPSVDPIDSKELPIHHALGRLNIHILESLDLREPPLGRYELVALPLRIAGGDASPVRAILRDLV